MSQHQNLTLKNITAGLKLLYLQDEQWHCAELDSAPEGFVHQGEGISINL